MALTSNELYQPTIDAMAVGNPAKYAGKKWSDLDDAAKSSVKTTKSYLARGSARFTPTTLIINGKKQTVNIQGLDQQMADQITEGLKGIKKWQMVYYIA